MGQTYWVDDTYLDQCVEGRPSFGISVQALHDHPVQGPPPQRLNGRRQFQRPHLVLWQALEKALEKALASNERVESIGSIERVASIGSNERVASNESNERVEIIASVHMCIKQNQRIGHKPQANKIEVPLRPATPCRRRRRRRCWCGELMHCGTSVGWWGSLLVPGPLR